MTRILLLFRTTTYRAEAFLRAAERLGVETSVATEVEPLLARFHRPGNLAVCFDDPGAGAAAIAEFARLHPIDAIVAADDDGVLLAAHASALLGLPGNTPDAVNAARNKHLFRQVTSRAGFTAPWFRCADRDDSPREWAVRVRYPCVLKPTFLSGSRGVIRAAGPAEFEWAFLRIRSLLASEGMDARGGDWAREVLIEEYLPGDEVALEGLLTAGDLRTLALFDKPDPLEGPYFEETIYVTPSRLDDATQRAVHDAAARAARAMGLTTGPLHAELRVLDGHARLVEIAPRSIGGLCSRVLRFGDGTVPLEEVLLRHALREDVSHLVRERDAAAVMMIPVPRGGILRSVRGCDEAEGLAGVDEVRITIPPGDLVIPAPDGFRYLGFIFARGERPDDAERAVRDAHRALRFEIDEVD